MHFRQRRKTADGNYKGEKRYCRALSLLVTDYVLTNSQFAKLCEGVKNYRDADLLTLAQERELGSSIIRRRNIISKQDIMEE